VDIELIKARLYLPKFQDYSLIELALCHKTYLNEKFAQDENTKQQRLKDHKRLAHLGDYIMNVAIGDYVFRRFPDCEVGILNNKAQPLKERRTGALAYAKAIGLDQPGICQFGGSINEPARKGDLFGEIFEALMGAIYLSSDRQFTVAHDWFYAHCTETMERLMALEQSKP